MHVGGFFTTGGVLVQHRVSDVSKQQFEAFFRPYYAMHRLGKEKEIIDGCSSLGEWKSVVEE